MKYHTRTKWADGDMTVSELPFDSIKAAAEAVVSEGDFDTGYVCEFFAIFEDLDGSIKGAQNFTQTFKEACFEYWCAKYEANYCDSVPKIIEDLVDERFMFDGEVYVIRKGME